MQATTLTLGCEQAGDVAQAKLCFDAAAHSSPQPDNPTVHTNMGLLELSVCNLESAQAHFAAAAPTAIASDTDSQQCSNATVQRVVSMNNVAVCKMQSGNADGARVTLEVQFTNTRAGWGCMRGSTHHSLVWNLTLPGVAT